MTALTIPLAAQLACLWEATARKPGNVHRYADFDDLEYLDFLQSAAAMAPTLADAPSRGLGATILAAVRATRRVVATNTNLGIVLLLAPLAAVADDTITRAAVEEVLVRTTVEDTRLAYEAIRLAAPGGLGRAPSQDVRDEPTLPLREVMALAAERDLVARQYANGFVEVLTEGVPALEQGLARCGCLEGAIVFCQLTLLSRHPDSLIARKRGLVVAAEASRRAAEALAVLGTPEGARALAELDAWLRGDGHARNPGTTADLVTASLFAALRNGTIPLPRSVPWALS